MLSDLNDHLLNDLSLIVIEYVNFSDKQLSLLMNQKIHQTFSLWSGHLRYLTREEGEKVAQYHQWSSTSLCALMTADERLSIVFILKDILLVKTENFSQYICCTQACRRCADQQKKYSFHFHGSTLVIADDDKTFRVYDFDSDFT
jgi:hypothetical protein